MVTDAVLSILASFIALVLSPFPTGNLGLAGVVQDLSDTVGELAGPLDKWLPITDLLLVMTIVVTVWLPAISVYVLANWVYRHIPVVAGG